MNSKKQNVTTEQWEGRDLRVMTPYLFIAPAVFVMLAGLAWSVV